MMSPVPPELQKHAELAIAAAGVAVRPDGCGITIAVQKYLLTGDEAAHQTVKDLSTNVTAICRYLQCRA